MVTLPGEGLGAWRARQSDQLRSQFQCRTRAKRARRGARCRAQSPAQLQGRQLRRLPRPPAARRGDLPRRSARAVRSRDAKTGTFCCARRAPRPISSSTRSNPELPMPWRSSGCPRRIERIERLAHDVLAVFLKLPAAEPMSFQAGQYLDIMLPGGRRRSFSIASPPHDSRLLELHVRRVPGGELTEKLFGANARGTLLSIEGPLGQFAYRPAAAGVPMLMVGGGTGLAPLKSILRHVIENGSNRRMMLYWGVRAERDLYAHRELQDLAGRHGNFLYQPVLSEPGAAWAGRRGFVHEAVLHDLRGLDGHDIYASGPPAMVEAVRREFVLRGADPGRLFFDSFDYAPDALERQRTMAADQIADPRLNRLAGSAPRGRRRAAPRPPGRRAPASALDRVRGSAPHRESAAMRPRFRRCWSRRSEFRRSSISRRSNRVPRHRARRDRAGRPGRCRPAPHAGRVPPAATRGRACR